MPVESRADWLSWKDGVAFAALAVAAFHLAYGFPALSFLMLACLYGLIQLTTLPTARQAFYFGLAVGYAVYAPHLTFFWTIFGWPAVALWTVLAFWLGLFVVLGRLCRLKFGRIAAAILIPFVWTGLEYFRSELYYLRFSWLSVGYAFSESPQLFAMTRMGVYGVGYLLVTAVALLSLLSKRIARTLLVVGCVGLGSLIMIRTQPVVALPPRGVQVAGVQMEFPAPQEVPQILDQVLDRYPTTELLVLSEYTFDGPVPDRVKAWCRRRGKHLIAGGKDFLPENQFYNTAFVIGPDGQIAFRQAKSVPIQFFKDGLPAPEQKLWNSPWGKIGLCVCYDLSYRRVVDNLVSQGAQAIIAPTMDVADWGEYQHQLHGRVGPVRSAESGIPILRVCSSGVSQMIDAQGRVTASAPFSGERAMIAGQLDVGEPGRLPLDHWLAPFCVDVTAAMLSWLSGKSLLGRFSKL